jgi:hypothetical protein
VLDTNPDGRKHAEGGELWRKNTNEAYCGPTDPNRGADLNRNFEYQWGCCGGSSGSECSTTYRGPSPSSEPETQAVRDYARALFPDQKGPSPTDAVPTTATGIFLDIHSHGMLVMWAWGFTSFVSPNGPAMRTLGRRLAYFNGYKPQQAVHMYLTDGSTVDFACGELGVPAYVFELGTDFFQDCDAFADTILPDNLEAVRYLAKVARTPYLTPSGPSVTSVLSPAGTAIVPPGDAVEARIVVDDLPLDTSNGTDPTQSITAAEVYLDEPPWQVGAVPLAMSPADGSFDSKTETVETTLATTGLSEARHMLYFRGQDASGQWGPVSAALFWVQDLSQMPHISGVVTDSGTGLPLAAAVTAGTYSTTTNPGDGSYSLEVVSNTYSVTASSPEHTPKAVAGVVATSGNTTKVDFALTQWPRLQGRVIEHGTGLPLAGTVSAGSFSTSTSAGDGGYGLAVEPGTYDVTARAPDHAFSTVTGVVATSGITTVNFVLRPMVTLLWDDVEAGNIGWTMQTAIDPPGGTNWSIVTDGVSNHSWFSSDDGDVKDDRLIAGPFSLNEGTTLSFDHHWAFEFSGDYPWDGGVLEISTDGTSWQDVLGVGGTFVEGGYNGTLLASPSNPLGGRQAWVAASPGTVHTVVDLAALAGESVHVRFRLGCDSLEGDVGWYVDSILLRTAIVGEPSPVRWRRGSSPRHSP